MASLDCDFTVHVPATFPITMDKKYQTRDGRAVEILRTGLYCDSPFNVLGIIWKGDGKCIVEAWTPEGKTTHDSIVYNNDLIPVPTKHEGWGVIRMRSRPNDIASIADGAIFETLFEAQHYMEDMCMAGAPLAHVTWES